MSQFSFQKRNNYQHGHNMQLYWAHIRSRYSVLEQNRYKPRPVKVTHRVAHEIELAIKNRQLANSK